jgi:glycosyltransferase involved in cell wall biosynthesis
MSVRKNLVRLLDAWKTVQISIRDVKLVLIGGSYPGFRDPGLRREDLSPGVRLMGYVPEKDLPGLYAGALALVIPSLYEGFGLPVLEAMACGTPVVASAGGALSEVVGEAGVLVNPYDTREIALAIGGLIADHRFRKELSRRGREWSIRFSWARTASEVRKVLLESSRSPFQAE